MIFAVASFALQQFGIYLFVLIWIYNWGPGVALAIQIGMLGLGAALVVWTMMRGRAKARD